MSDTQELERLKALSDKELIEEWRQAWKGFQYHAAAEGHQYFKEQSSMYSCRRTGERCELIMEERGITAIKTITSTYDYINDVPLSKTDKIEWFKNGEKIYEGGEV